jgi:DUF1365 family protein
VHARSAPKKHAFSYRIFMFYLDLDELDTVSDHLWMVSRNKRNIYSFRDRDHVRMGASDVRGNIEAFLKTQGLIEKPRKLYLLTMMRTWGYLFNPVSFYMICNEADEPTGVVLEVANTFNEQKLYYIPKDKIHGAGFRDAQKKHFYISPFSPLDLNLEFLINIPAEKLLFTINERNDAGEKIFTSVLSGNKRPLTNRALVAETLRFPWITLQVMFGIHWQAFLLWAKKIPYFKKRLHPELQIDVRPYLGDHT